MYHDLYFVVIDFVEIFVHHIRLQFDVEHLKRVRLHDEQSIFFITNDKSTIYIKNTTTESQTSSADSVY